MGARVSAALVSPAVRGVAIVDPRAREAVLYLTAVDDYLRETPGDPADVIVAHRALRSSLARYAPTAYAAARVDDDRERRWIVALQAAVRPLGDEGVAAAAWAATLAWAEVDGRAWRHLAGAVERLARAIEADVARRVLAAEGAADAGRRAGARWEVSQRVARAAVDLRATMGGVAAGLWARGAG